MSDNDNDPNHQQPPQPPCPCCASWRRVEDEPPPPRAQAPPLALGQFFVLRNAQVYTLDDDNDDDEESPPPRLDVWIGAGKIWALIPSSSTESSTEQQQQSSSSSASNSRSKSCPTIPGLQELDLTGYTLCPGLVDMHQHIVGGGGEAGFASRTPSATRDDIVTAGVTTFVATLGTDTVTRSMQDLIAATRALSGEALTGRTWLGGYAFPIENCITGNVARDVTMIPEIIGVGELAISDHRASYMSTAELTRLASAVRVAGMLAGKAGVTYLHVGDDATGLQPLRDVVQQNPVLQTFLVPTHVERTAQLVQEGWEWMTAGGRIDFSGWPARQRTALRQYLQTVQGTRFVRDRLSISSDGYGSINVFDKLGKLVKYSYGLPSTLLRTLMALVYEDKLPMGLALRLLCRNPAAVIGLEDAPMYKGRLRVGGDADLLVLKLPPLPLPDDYPMTREYDMDWPSTEGVLQYVIAKGVVLKSPSSTAS